MAEIFAAAGTTIEIGQTIASQSDDFVEADFDAQSWVSIGRLNSIPAFGDAASEIAYDLLGENRTQTLKGTRKAGNPELIFARDSLDEGQQTLLGAETMSNNFAFRVTFNDPGALGNKSKRYFIARVMSAQEEVGTANNVVQLRAQLAINSNIVRTPAS
jgi:hypothetical protein